MSKFQIALIKSDGEEVSPIDTNYKRLEIDKDKIYCAVNLSFQKPLVD